MYELDNITYDVSIKLSSSHAWKLSPFRRFHLQCYSSAISLVWHLLVHLYCVWYHPLKRYKSAIPWAFYCIFCVAPFKRLNSEVTLSLSLFLLRYPRNVMEIYGPTLSVKQRKKSSASSDLSVRQLLLPSGYLSFFLSACLSLSISVRPSISRSVRQWGS